LRAERQPFIPDFGRSTEMKMPQLCACGKQFSIVVVISKINFCCTILHSSLTMLSPVLNSSRVTTSLNVVWLNA
jgi:hypothetical protein